MLVVSLRRTSNDVADNYLKQFAGNLAVDKFGKRFMDEYPPARRGDQLDLRSSIFGSGKYHGVLCRGQDCRAERRTGAVVEFVLLTQTIARDPSYRSFDENLGENFHSYPDSFEDKPLGLRAFTTCNARGDRPRRAMRASGPVEREVRHLQARPSLVQTGQRLHRSVMLWTPFAS
jgi:hypothetical protein